MTRFFLAGLALLAVPVQAQNLAAQRGQILDQAAYLRHLEDTKKILQIESEIAALREQCRAQGFVCTGGEDVQEIIVEQPATAPEAPAPISPVQGLTLVGIAGGRARIASRGAGLSELTEGREIHGWRVMEIELDRVHLDQNGRRHTLHLDWLASSPQAEEDT